MRAADLPLALETGGHAPLFVRISRAVARDIARGRLRPGQALPGSRTLAQTLSVHRSTVIAAYAELAAQGWVTTRPAGATIVDAASPDERPRRGPSGPAKPRGMARTPGFPLAPAPVGMTAAAPPPPLPRDGIYLWGGVPDLRLVPVDLLARAYRRAARRSGGRLFGYSDDSLGHARLRAAIARLATVRRGIPADADAVLITRGSQMALDVAARTLIRPGDVVAVEALCYPNAIAVFRRAGAKIVPLPIDDQGI